MSDTQTHFSDYAMPSLGADMDEGSVIEWLVAVGDHVERGQVVARVETEKSDIDIEIWHDGTVAEIVVEPNRTVPVGTTLMRVATAEESDVSQPVVPLPAPPPQRHDPVDVTHGAARDPAIVERAVPRGAVWATPLARHLAGEQGIELSDVAGSGPDGAVRAVDLGRAAVQAPARPSRADRMRRIIAVRMARSNNEIPHYRLQRDVDLNGLVEHLSSINGSRPIADRIVPAAAFVRAVAIAANRHRELNGTWSDDRFHAGLSVNVSVAISLRGGGLVTPTIRHADTKSLDEVMSTIKEFAAAARGGTMRSEWMASDSSITVTNLGDRGADLVHGLISPPEVALVGFGRILERPWVVDGDVTPRSIVTVTLGADHRATDGAVGSRFLATLANALEEPVQL
jgi:pyruvate dehydrogenase E2 component (dihydrolipoamide acetyltransferase)